MMFQQTTLLVWFFYITSASYFYNRARDFTHLADSVGSFDLLWPVAWLSHTGLDLGGKIIAHTGLAAAVLGLLWWRFLVVRVLVSIALLQYAAFASSSGAIQHGYHEWFWISVCFLLLPNGRIETIAATRVQRMRFLTAFSLAPLLILLFYSLSGFYKCGHALAALVKGNIGGFSPDAMGITLAARAVQTGSEPMWANFAIDHPVLSWPFYLGLYFVELVSLAVFFRPQLHRIWGMTLILFHVGTLLFMDIIFGQHILINGMLFLLSPFALGRASINAQLESVPVLGTIYAVIRHPRLEPTLSKSRVVAS
jgi:hypothetical protein